MVIPQQAVIAAWADVKPDFATQAKGSRLPNHQAAIPDVGLCRLGSSRTTGWANRGGASLDLSDLTITRFDGIVLQPATFTDATTVSLPIKFGALEVNGRYRIESKCILVGAFGMEMDSQTQSASGTVTETFGSSSLIYTAKVGTNLTITGVHIPGTPSVDVKSDSGLPGWLQKFAAVMSGQDLQEAIRGGLVNIFQTAGFASTMIANLNKKLGV